MAGGRSLEARSWSESGSIERSGYETPEGVKLQTGLRKYHFYKSVWHLKQLTGEGAAVKYPSAPRKSVAPQSSRSDTRKTASAPRGDASHESGPDAVEDGGGHLSKDGEAGGVESAEVRRAGNQIGSAAGDKVVRKLTYSSAQKGPGGGVVRKVGQA